MGDDLDQMVYAMRYDEKRWYGDDPGSSGTMSCTDAVTVHVGVLSDLIFGGEE